MNLKYLTYFSILLVCSCSGKKNYVEKYPNGRVKIEGQTLDDQRVGEWFQYDSTGALTKKYVYENDVKRKSWTYLDTALYAIQEFNENEEKDGFTTTFYADGSIQTKTKWMKGRQFGEQLFYFPNTSLQKSYTNTHDKTVNYKQYYNNGNLMAEAEVLGEGLVHFYDSLGNKTITIRMENGRNVDTVQVFQ